MVNAVHSNVRRITSGKIPTIAELPAGHIAFGKISSDGNYHVYGNPDGKGVIDLTQQYLNQRLEKYYDSNEVDAMIQELEAKIGPKTYIQENEPENFGPGDLWFQILPD